MDEWTGMAFGAFALSSFISVLRIGHWILHAEPRAIINAGINAGRWSLALIALLSLVALLWLTIRGQWTSAMLLAAFILPVLVQAAPRWRVLLDPIGFFARSSLAPDLSEGGPVDRRTRTQMRGSIDPKLVEQCAAILEAYLDQTRRHVACNPKAIAFESEPANGSPNGSGRRRMSIEEALDVLGLETTASASEIGEAHRRLQEKLDPLLGGKGYLTMKLNEARDILLGE
ncbi:MAG TPA: hypothetical protein VLZ74_10825 [Methylocella sp.]|nr:hypothetical protein [Methylocella sp.]